MAAQFANFTQGNDAEGEEINASKPTLKTCFSNLPNVYNKLLQEGMNKLDDLLFVKEDELNELCGSDILNLKGMEKIRFKSTVRKIQSQYAPKKEPDFIAITMAEQNEMNQINILCNKMNDIQTVFESHFNQIEDHVNKMKASVDAQFDDISKALRQRKVSLYKEIEEWKVNKLENINKIISNIVKYKNEIKSTKNECNELLKNSNNNNEDVLVRQDKIKQITKETFAKQTTFDPFYEFISQNTNILNITFRSRSLKKELNSYGKLDKNPSIKIPTISLKKPIKINYSRNGYVVKLKWSILNKENNDNILVNFIQCDDNDIDEKKTFENTEIMKWKNAEYLAIKSNDNREFEVDIKNIFTFDVMYKFQIKLNVKNPIHSIFKSNIVEFIVNDEPPKGNVIKMPLQYHSHRKHYYDKYHPRNLLVADDKIYYSSPTNSDFGDEEVDWIIFKCSDLWFPTKFVIKNRGTTTSVQTMRILIGNDNNKWFPLNSNETTVAFTKQYHSFSISGIDYNLIKKNQLKRIKLEFITNHGSAKSDCVRFIVPEFQLHGIKL